MQSLSAKIAGVQKQLDNLDDIPKNDTTRAQLEAVLATYKQNLGILQYNYQQCEANNPPPSPPASVPAFVPATGAPDPQLAVGKNYLVSVDTQSIVFYARAADGSIDLTQSPFSTSTYN